MLLLDVKLSVTILIISCRIELGGIISHNACKCTFESMEKTEEKCNSLYEGATEWKSNLYKLWCRRNRLYIY